LIHKQFEYAGNFVFFFFFFVIFVVQFFNLEFNLYRASCILYRFQLHL